MASTINADTSNGVIITPDTSGEIELQANGVTKAKVTANGLQDANGNSLRGGSYRNLIINGDMRIAQRGTSASGKTTGGYFTVDRMNTTIGTAGTWTMSQDTDVPSGQGFANSLKMECTTANASLSSGSAVAIDTRFEGQNLQHLKKGTSSAESLTLSFWVKSNKTGTYIAELYDIDNTRQISQSYTINSADTWENKVITIDGDTTGVLNNDNGLSLIAFFWLAAGSTFSGGTLNTSWAAAVNANRVVGQVNLADSTSNYINITGVQLEVGEGASDFEFLPYDVQLQRCQRYYETGSARLGAYTHLGANYPIGMLTGTGFKVTKRTTPDVSITTTSSSSIYTNSGNTANINVSSFSQAGLVATQNNFGSIVISWTAGAEL